MDGTNPLHGKKSAAARTWELAALLHLGELLEELSFF